MIDRDEIIQRFGFHKGTEETIPLHAATRANFIELAEFIAQTTDASREQSLALTALQEAAMWVNCAIAMTAPLVVDSVPPALTSSEGRPVDWSSLDDPYHHDPIFGVVPDAEEKRP